MINIPGMGDLPDMDEMTDKVKDKVDFPATKDDIVNAVDKIPGIPEKAKDFLDDKLPEREYDSIDDVKAAVGL